MVTILIQFRRIVKWFRWKAPLATVFTGLAGGNEVAANCQTLRCMRLTIDKA